MRNKVRPTVRTKRSSRKKKTAETSSSSDEDFLSDECSSAKSVPVPVPTRRTRRRSDIPDVATGEAIISAPLKRIDTSKVRPVVDADNCAYFQKIDRPGLNEYKQVHAPKDPACVKYCSMSLTHLRNRIKFICKRMRITQTQLSQSLNLNNGNMSGALLGMYSAASATIYIYVLSQWAFYMDKKFVDEFKAEFIMRDLGDAANTDEDEILAKIAAALSTEVDLLSEFMSFECDPSTREPIDNRIMKYLNLDLSFTGKRGRRLIEASPPTSMDVSPGSDTAIDLKTQAVLDSWLSRSSDILYLPDSDSGKYICPGYSSSKFKCSDKPQIHTLNAFGLYSDESSANVIINAGGPITLIEWVPRAASQTQFLLVCSEYKQGESNKKQNALIQIYELGGTSSFPDTTISRMRLGIVIDQIGAIYCAQFCPFLTQRQDDSGDDTSGNLGVLAISGADGSMRIYVIPHPDLLSQSDSIMIKISPVFHFSISEFPVFTFRWHRSNSKEVVPVILAGSYQGSVLLWDIRTGNSSPELVAFVARTVNDCVTQVAWCHHNRFDFVIGTHSGLVRLYDVRCPGTPLWTFDAFRPVYGIEPMADGNGYALAIATGIRFLSVSNGSSSAPLFWLDLPFEGATPTSLSSYPLFNSVALSLTTDTGCCAFAIIESRTHLKKSQQRRIVEVPSYIDVTSVDDPSERPLVVFGSAVSTSTSLQVISAAKANAPRRERLRSALPKHASSELLLNHDHILSCCSFNPNIKMDVPLFVSGGRLGIVRVQRLPPIPALF
uniref:Uncharacterized protein n=1 Tax=Spongospora subterranea TaxID=70186 RepID=A0A0H5QKS8_9EUKA|eukprot:CRZ01926.1 hypothetical protein [Spongospora subterranea]